jgi:hypothetical protein
VAYQRAQDELVEARNRLARAIAGAAMSGMTKDEIVDLTGYPPTSSCGSAPMRQERGLLSLELADLLIEGG